jgi:hypothetical protein
MADIKRLNYFNHQFLVDTDFRDEQHYHIEMRRRHNRFMHGWGVAEGLLVEQSDQRQILVTPGMAIDMDGREIVLLEPKTLTVAPLEKAGHVFAVVSYREEGADQQGATGVMPNFTRMAELASISITHHPPHDGTAIALARIYLDDAGLIKDIDLSVRHDATLQLRPGIVTTEALADDAVTTPKLAPNLRRQQGWVRMSFKPHPMHERPAFHVGPTEARSEKSGAYGTMGVPAPPGANKVTGFRIAGEWNDGDIVLDLFRSGWDEKRQQHEREFILRDEKLTGSKTYRKRDGVDRDINPFERAWDLDYDLDRGHHALAVLIRTTQEASISLIAVRFEYDLREYQRRQLRPGRA